MGNILPTKQSNLLPSFYQDERILGSSQSEIVNQYIDLFTKRVQENSTLIEDYIELGNLFRQRKSFQKAYKVHRNLLARQDLSKEQKGKILCEMGYDYLVSKTKDFGESYFLQALDVNKRSAYARHGLFQAYRNQKKYPQAIETLEKLIELEPSKKNEMGIIYSELAMMFLGENNLSQAKKWHERSLAFEKTPFHCLTRIQILISEDKKQKAIEELIAMVMDYPEHSYFAINKLQDLYFDTNQYSNFVQALVQCEQHNPSNHYVQHALGKYYEKTRQMEKAKEHYLRAMDLCSYSLQVFRDGFSFLKNQGSNDLQWIVDRFVQSLSQFKKLTCNGCQREHYTIPKDCNICHGWNLFDIHYTIPHH